MHPTVSHSGLVQSIEMRFDLVDGARKYSPQGAHTRRVRATLPPNLNPETIRAFDLKAEDVSASLAAFEAEVAYFLAILYGRANSLSAIKMSPQNKVDAVVTRNNTKHLVDTLVKASEAFQVTHPAVGMDLTHTPAVPIITVTREEYVSLAQACPSGWRVDHEVAVEGFLRVGSVTYVPLFCETDSIQCYRAVDSATVESVGYMSTYSRPTVVVGGARMCVINDAISVRCA